VEWYWILLIVLGSSLLLFLLSIVLYRQFFKRFWDIVLSFLAITVFSPLIIILMIVGAIAMKGNPFFVQKRPGKKGKDGKERIFSLIKFRTMSNAKDKDGNLLPDDKRLNGYGKFLRSTSLDELPEAFNIFIGDMSVIGPRPLLVRYLDRYNEEQHHRHDVRPGLSGYAQVHGRNALSWDEKFKMDVWYTQHLSIFLDIKIIFESVFVMFKRDGISSGTNATMEEFMGNDK
jgi:lipopolysaccharide/colanic/teichoic acid biosynthesis glycosyltransferase